MTDHTTFTAITRRCYEYALGIDSRDFDLLRSVFTEEITMDFSSYSGKPAATIEADQWVERLQPLMLGLDATQHTMTNPIVDVDRGGRTARCRVSMQATHWLNYAPEPEFVIGGYYDNHFVLIDGEWRIMAVALTVSWRRGNEAIMAEARERGTDLLG